MDTRPRTPVTTMICLPDIHTDILCHACRDVSNVYVSLVLYHPVYSGLEEKKKIHSYISSNHLPGGSSTESEAVVTHRKLSSCSSCSGVRLRLTASQPLLEKTTKNKQKNT